ncbi:MAG TPA: hypothetical protein VHN78_01025, partial [Chloroflexota bacterium]|nr:hypothetical protein [Chloroflexota bacterium]
MSTAPSHTAGSRSGAVASLRFIWGLGPTTLAAVVLAVALPGPRTRLFRHPAAHTCAGAALFGAGLATMPLGLVLWLFVALVYGSTIGIPYSSYGPGWSRNDRSGSRWKYPIALLALFLA